MELVQEYTANKFTAVNRYSGWVLEILIRSNSSKSLVTGTRYWTFFKIMINWLYFNSSCHVKDNQINRSKILGEWNTAHLCETTRVLLYYKYKYKNMLQRRRIVGNAKIRPKLHFKCYKLFFNRVCHLKQCRRFHCSKLKPTKNQNTRPLTDRQISIGRTAAVKPCRVTQTLSSSRTLYSCPYCNYTTTKPNNLAHHKFQVHSEKKHVCLICNAAFRTPGHLQQHQEVHQTKSFKCKDCEFVTSRESRLKVHAKVHLQEKEFSCSHCSFASKYMNMLTAHIRRYHSGVEEKRYKCEACEYSTDYSSNLSKHRLTHSATKPNKCHLCDYGAIRIRDLKIHFKKKHNCEYVPKTDAKSMTSATQIDGLASESHGVKSSTSATLTRSNKGKSPNRPKTITTSTSTSDTETKSKRAEIIEETTFSCQLCEYSTHAKRNFKHHIRHTHSNHKPFKCTSCDASFPTAARLRGHQIAHQPEKGFECEQCGFRTRYKRALTAHMTTHEIRNKYAFACSECEYCTYSEKLLKNHYYQCHCEKQFKCDKCVEGFKVKKQLMVHKLVHTEEKHLKCTKCVHCTKYTHSFYEHQLMHAGTKTRKCPCCPFKTHYNSSLSRHRRAHLDYKPYKCDLCDYRAPTTREIRSHKTNNHFISSQTMDYECNSAMFKKCHKNYGLLMWNWILQSTNKNIKLLLIYHCHIYASVFKLLLFHALKIKVLAKSDPSNFSCYLRSNKTSDTTDSKQNLAMASYTGGAAEKARVVKLQKQREKGRAEVRTIMIRM